MTTATFAASTALWFFAGATIFAGARDVLTMKISNKLILLLLAAYAALAPLAGYGMELIAVSILTALAVLGVTFVLFALGWIGGGDAKLAAVTVLWIGPELTPDYLLYTAVFGALFALALLVFRRMPLFPFLKGYEWSTRLHAPTTGIPYGVPMAFASLLVLPETHWATLFQ
jgi:prepilin peptidase CpaA